MPSLAHEPITPRFEKRTGAMICEAEAIAVAARRLLLGAVITARGSFGVEMRAELLPTGACALTIGRRRVLVSDAYDVSMSLFNKIAGAARACAILRGDG